MNNYNQLKQQTTIDLLLLELNEIRQQINHVSSLSHDKVPEISKEFLLEDLKQYESYLVMKLAKETGIINFSNN